MLNIEELKRLAEAVAPWVVNSAWEGELGTAMLGHRDGEDNLYEIACFDVTMYDGFEGDSLKLASYTAAANPAAVLELIAEVEYRTGKAREHFDACMGCDEVVKEVTAQRDELLANVPEWHCKTCNTIHLPPKGCNLCCPTPKCTGLLKPSSPAIRAVEDQRDELLAVLREIAEWTERYTTPGHPISTVARAAIAKAEG